MEDIKQIINTVLKNRGKPNVSDVSRENLLRDDFGFDSLDLAELTVRIEAQYDVDIFENGIISTVGQIYDIIEDQ